MKTEVSPLSLAVIGCGRIGRAHIKAAMDDPACRVHALADPVMPSELAHSLGIADFTDDYRQILARPEIDAVIIATPTDTHLPIALDAVAAGKHVLVEKPVTLDAAGAIKLNEAAERAGVTVMVGQSRRFPSAAAELKRRLPELGEIFRIHIQFLVSFPAPPTDWWKSAKRSRGLVIPLQGSHSLDSIVWWMGEAPESVYATGSRRNPAWEGEDEADIICRFAGGQVATVHLSLSTDPAVHEALVIGEKGNLRLVEEANGQSFGWSFRLEKNGVTVFEDAMSFPYQHQLTEFLEALREKRAPLAHLPTVIPSMHAMDAAIESMSANRPVSVGTGT